MIRTLCLASLALSAAAPAFAQELQPGEYRTVSTVTSVDIPGMPPEMTAGMVGQGNTATVCITAEQIAQGPAAMTGADGQCTFSEYSLSGGEMTMAGTCQGGMGGGEMSMTGTGTYDSDSFEMTMTAKGEMPTGVMTFESTSTGERLGDC